MEKVEPIGRHQYAHLKTIAKNKLSQDQFAQIEQYEREKLRMSNDYYAKMSEYMEKLKSPIVHSEVSFTSKDLFEAFCDTWPKIHDNELILDQDMIDNLRIVNRYFAKDESFAEGCSDITKPSLDKGLLIIGGYGNGKTSTMQVIHNILSPLFGHSFAFYTANEVVDKFESCQSEQDRFHFWKQFTKGRYWFDDVLGERTASNYGKVEVFQELLEKRYASKAKTFITCNSSNMDKPMEDFAMKYGERVYDRLFQMFNVIIWKGESRRI